MKINTLFSYFFLIFICNISLFASCENCKEYCECDSSCNCSLDKCALMDHTRGPQRMITPPAGPCITVDSANFYLTADFIYWTAREDQLFFVNRAPLAVVSGPVPTAKGRVFSPKWRYKPGFKVGAGLNYDHDGWDVYANYTWFKMRDTKRKVKSTNSKIPQDTIIFINGKSANQGNPFIYNHSKAKWHLNFEVVDLELGRNFFISDFLTLRPHFGLKGSWQKQKFNVLFKGVTSQGNQLVRNRSNNKLNYWGVGIRSGLDTAWYFIRGLGLFGDIAITGLWEDFESRRSDAAFNVSSGTATVGWHNESKNHTLKPIIEWEIGLRWETWFCDCQYHFELDAGWEMQDWFEQNQFLTLYSTRNSDLILQGLNVKVRFDF